MHRRSAIRGPLALATAVAAALTLSPAVAHAQLEAFSAAVSDLARAATREPRPQADEIRAIADRMDTALVEWDRRIAALESRVAQAAAGAPDRQAYQMHVELGVAYRARGRMDEALREFDAAARLERSASDVHVLRALTLDATGRHDEAARAFVAAWKQDPTNSIKAYYVARRTGDESPVDRDRARAQLADAYRHGLDAAAPAVPPFIVLDAIADTSSRAPVVADARVRESFGLLATRQYSEAVAALRRAAREDRLEGDDSPLAHFRHGQRDEAESRVTDARREYEAAVQGTVAGRNVLYVAIGRLAQVDGDLPAALDAFARAVALNPNDPAIHKEFAGALASQGRSDDAFCELMAAALVDPRDAGAHVSIGQLFLDDGRNADAAAAFGRALQLAPDRYEIRYALATAYTRLGDGPEAQRQLDLFDRARREALERRRRDIDHGVEQEETIRRGSSDQDRGR